MIRQLDDERWSAARSRPTRSPGWRQQGVTVLVNNRPDGEEPGQPLASEIEEAAAAAGIAYRFVPIIRGIGPADVEAMQEALARGRGRQAAGLLPLGHALGACARLGHASKARRARRSSSGLTRPVSTPARSRTCSSSPREDVAGRDLVGPRRAAEHPRCGAGSGRSAR